MSDLRSFLAEHAQAVWELPDPAGICHDLTALQHALDGQRRYPVVMARSVSTLGGQPSAIPVVLNLTASRELTAGASSST